MDAHLGPAAFLPRSLEELGRETTDIPILMGQTDADGNNFFGISKKADCNNIQCHNTCTTFNILLYPLSAGSVIGYIDFVRDYVILFVDPVYIGDARVEAEVVARVREYYFDAPRCRVKDNLVNRAVDVSIQITERFASPRLLRIVVRLRRMFLT